MTLDEAIKQEEKLADDHDRIKKIKAVTLEECRRAEEHRQLAEWLKDYQRLLEEQQVDDAKKHFEIICKISQNYGMPYSFVEEKIKETEKALLELSTQEPCDDCISRESIIEIVNRQRFGMSRLAFGIITEKVKALQSVTPAAKAGRGECEGKKRDCTDCVLDKIRSEIEQEYNRLKTTRSDETLELGECLGLKMSLKIIDKYKTEGIEK